MCSVDHATLEERLARLVKAPASQGIMRSFCPEFGCDHGHPDNIMPRWWARVVEQAERAMMFVGCDQVRLDFIRLGARFVEMRWCLLYRDVQRILRDEAVPEACSHETDLRFLSEHRDLRVSFAKAWPRIVAAFDALEPERVAKDDGIVSRLLASHEGRRRGDHEPPKRWAWSDQVGVSSLGHHF